MTGCDGVTPFLQTIQGSKLVADFALKNPRNPDETQSSLRQLSEWLDRGTPELLRHERPYIKVNCAAIPFDLLEMAIATGGILSEH